MKFLLAAVVTSLAAAGHANASHFYNPAKNVTCTADSGGSIACQAGHLFEAIHLDKALGSLTTRNENGLQKRLSCSFTAGGIGACPLHCYTDGYCNSYCDPKSGICHCTCLDQTGTCSRTTCSPP